MNLGCNIWFLQVGILLCAYGYSSDTIIYIVGGEAFGGRKILIPLHGMFENVNDRTSLSTARELTSIYGHEDCIVSTPHRQLPYTKAGPKLDSWKTSSSCPRPLPPPLARAKYPFKTSRAGGVGLELLVR